MGKVIISDKILAEPIMMMTVVLREIEEILVARGEDPTELKEKILAADTIPVIQYLVKEAVGDEIIIDA